MKLCFDMDGTLVNFYGVSGWLDSLNRESVRPYEVAAPLVNCSTLARMLNKLQKAGHQLVIVSWSSKRSNAKFDMAIEAAKRRWLYQHLPSVSWDEIHIVPYGRDKAEVCRVEGKNWILFDDEELNRKTWENLGGTAYNAEHILEVLREV